MLNCIGIVDNQALTNIFSNYLLDIQSSIVHPLYISDNI